MALAGGIASIKKQPVILSEAHFSGAEGPASAFRFFTLKYRVPQVSLLRPGKPQISSGKDDEELKTGPEPTPRAARKPPAPDKECKPTAQIGS
jgi:hypothetical protein